MKFRKKPICIEAVQLRKDTLDVMREFADFGSSTEGSPELFEYSDGRISMNIPTLEGVMNATEGDWIVRGIAGELYPCKDAIFSDTYERVHGEE